MRKQTAQAADHPLRPPEEIKERYPHCNPEEDSAQLTLDSASVTIAEREFQDAVRNFFAAAGVEEIEPALDELDRTRGILVREMGYTLFQLCELVDAA